MCLPALQPACRGFILNPGFLPWFMVLSGYTRFLQDDEDIFFLTSLCDLWPFFSRHFIKKLSCRRSPRWRRLTPSAVWYYPAAPESFPVTVSVFRSTREARGQTGNTRWADTCSEQVDRWAQCSDACEERQRGWNLTHGAVHSTAKSKWTLCHYSPTWLWQEVEAALTASTSCSMYVSNISKLHFKYQKVLIISM